MDGQPVVTTVISKVQQRQYLLYGVLAGLAVGWWWGGFQGDTTGYLMIGAVGVYIWYNSRAKPKPKTIYDIAREIARNHKIKTGVSLDWTNFECFWRGGDIHFFQFKDPRFQMTVKCKVSGVHEITHRSAESMKTERDNQYSETKVYEIE